MDVLYNRKLEERLAQEGELCKKELAEIYEVCTNFVLCVAFILWSYNMTYALCVIFVFMMKKLAPVSVIFQLSTNVDDELHEKVVLDCASTKGSCSAAHTQNETEVPFDNLLR